MSHTIEPNYDQLFLLPPCLEDWLPPDDPARFVRAFVDELDFREIGFPQDVTDQGRPRFSFSLLTKVWLYCRMHKLRSLRAMETGCYRDIGLIWLTGMNHPDHNTLWRFQRDYGHLLKEILKELIQIATKSGLVGMVLNAIDGTKIEADISPGKSCSSSLLKKILAHLDDIVIELSSSEESECPETTPSYRLSEDLSDPKQLSLVIQKLMKADKEGTTVVLGEDLSKEAVVQKLEEMSSSPEGVCHPVDPDARMMHCDRGQKPGYNAQVVVDDKEGLIVAADVTQQNNDRKQLGPMLEQAIDNVGRPAETTIGDGGYFSGAQLEQAKELQAPVLVNDTTPAQGKKDPYHQTHFTYDPGDDCYICPHGHKLHFYREVPGRNESVDRTYRCTVKNCRVKHECTSNRKGRTVVRSAFIEVIEANRNNLACEENRKLLDQRKSIVETVFGHIKQNEGYRRWRVRGLSKVRSEWHVLAIIYNLKKMYRLWRRGVFQFRAETLPKST